MGEKGDKKMRIYKKKSAEKDTKECDLSEFLYCAYCVCTFSVHNTFVVHYIYNLNSLVYTPLSTLYNCTL